MQAKGLVKFFTIALVLVCLYQLSFTFFASRVNNKAKDFALQTVGVDASDQNYDYHLDKQKRFYLDSVANKDVVNLGVTSYTYNECKEKQINLGLDLQGGMSVTMQIALEDLIKSMANNSTDAVFTKSLADAKSMMKNSQENYVTLFGRAFSQNANGAKLAPLFSTRELSDRVNFNSSDSEVLDVINEEADKAVQRTFNIIRTRIDKFGVSSPNISLQENTGRILVELPGVDDPDRVRKLLQASANLQFWETQINGPEVNNIIQQANSVIRKKQGITIADDIKEDKVVEEEPESFLDALMSKKLVTGSTIALKNVFFNTGSFDLKAESYAELGKLKEILANNPDAKVEISGHTDSQGDAAANVTLSQNRAKSVMDYLTSQGATADQLTAKGYGASVPVADNGTEEGRARNRRTEFKVIEGITEDTSIADNADNTEDGGLNLDGEETLEGDSLQQQIDKFMKENPFSAVLRPIGPGSSLVGTVEVKDTAKLNEYLRDPEVQNVFPPDIKFLYGSKALEFENDEGEKVPYYEIYAVKSGFRDLRPRMDGNVVTEAWKDFDLQQRVVVRMNMNSEGAAQWKKMTADNVGRQVAVVLDDQVYSAPRVNGEIAGGSTEISGNFSLQEAEDLANILKAGALPAPARIVEEAVVGPSLGQESIRNGLLSLLIGVALVLLFMILYYSKGGWVANLAVLLNLFFIMGVLSSLGATLTLPGMAGIVLTIGMAVDANVIIFERIREELAKGSGIRKAISDGYTKSYSAIIDANVTTLITAAILAYFGLGPVLGFATVLIIGIFSSLFTAILITRLYIEWRQSKGKEMTFSTGWSQGILKNTSYDFLGKRKKTYIMSGVIIALGLFMMGLKGFDQGVDFTGGRTYVVRFDQSVNTTQINDALKTTLEGNTLVRTFGGSNQVKITTSDMIDSDDTTSGDQVEAKVFAALESMLPAGTTFKQFKENSLMSSQKVGPTIANDIKRGAFYATIFALLGIFLYILVRFRKWQYGIAAVLTLTHDTLIVLSIFSIFSGILPFSLEINQAFIAAILTVIGYSLNDTVVVFDRIREYLGLYSKRDFKTVVNDAVNSTLSRTIVTSLTTLFVISILFVFGGEMIRGFSFALLIGVIVGTYSSIFIATPLVVDLTLWENERKASNTVAAKDKKKAYS